MTDEHDGEEWYMTELRPDGTIRIAGRRPVRPLPDAASLADVPTCHCCGQPLAAAAELRGFRNVLTTLLARADGRIEVTDEQMHRTVSQPMSILSTYDRLTARWVLELLPMDRPEVTRDATP